MNKNVTFTGGVHPPDGKEFAKNASIQVLQPKGNAVYPLSQHIGAPAKAVVNVGDKVRIGTLLAEVGGFVSSPIYAGISGTVKSIAPHRVQNGSMVPSITIENDFLYVVVVLAVTVVSSVLLNLLTAMLLKRYSVLLKRKSV